jgi:hypothetical protein
VRFSEQYHSPSGLLSDQSAFLSDTLTAGQAAMHLRTCFHIERSEWHWNRKELLNRYDKTKMGFASRLGRRKQAFVEPKSLLPEAKP